MHGLKVVLTTVLCVSSILSCLSWAMSASAHASAGPGTSVSWVHADGTETDLEAMMKKQSKWNKIAAALASLAAITQAGLVLIP